MVFQHAKHKARNCIISKFLWIKLAIKNKPKVFEIDDNVTDDDEKSKVFEIDGNVTDDDEFF